MGTAGEVNRTGVFDATRPQIVLYEPTPDGSLRLTGADFLVFADAWDANHHQDPPQLMGQLFHFFESPNRFGLPAFYTLHVWAWKDNPRRRLCELASRRFVPGIRRPEQLRRSGAL